MTYKTKQARGTHPRWKNKFLLVIWVAGLFFLLLTAMAAAGLFVQIDVPSKQAGWWMAACNLLLLAGLVLTTCGKRLVATLCATAGWGVAIFIGLELTRSTKLSPLPNSKFFLAHVCVCIVPLLLAAFWLSMRNWQKRADDAFFMKTVREHEKKKEEKAASVLDKPER